MELIDLKHIWNIIHEFHLEKSNKKINNRTNAFVKYLKPLYYLYKTMVICFLSFCCSHQHDIFQYFIS